MLSVMSLSIAIGAIDTVAVILRLCARLQNKAILAIDDWLIVISLIPLYTMITSSILLATRGGLGEPIASLSRERATLFLKILMSTMITYSLTITFVKISLLLLYRRIFSTPEFRRRSACVGCACVAWFVAEVLANIFQCRPFSSAFDPEKLYTSNCINLQAFYWGITIANLVLDVAVLSLPVHMVWTLKLSLRKRVELSVIFALGGVGCIAGIMRVVSIGKLRQEDITLTMTREYVWSQIEPAVAILCACFVTYKPLLARLRTSVSSVFDSHERTSISGHWTDMRNHKRSTVRWPVAQDFGYAALQSPRCPVRRSGDPARPREIVIRIEGPDDGYFELSEVEQALDRRHRI